MPFHSIHSVGNTLTFIKIFREFSNDLNGEILLFDDGKFSSKSQAFKYTSIGKSNALIFDWSEMVRVR